MRAGASICDQGSGMWAVIGALALLQRRQQTGRGGIVGTSLLEAAMGWNAQKADALRNEGRFTIPTSIALEKQTNPYMRVADSSIRAHLGLESATDEDVFAEIRARKDKF